jgi:hypothetical protein
MSAFPEPAARFEIVELNGKSAIRDNRVGTTHLATSAEDAAADLQYLADCAARGDETEIATHLAFNAATAERMQAPPPVPPQKPVRVPGDEGDAIIALASTWRDAAAAETKAIAAGAQRAEIERTRQQLAAAHQGEVLARSRISQSVALLYHDAAHASRKLSEMEAVRALETLAADPALVSPLTADLRRPDETVQARIVQRAAALSRAIADTLALAEESARLQVYAAALLKHVGEPPTVALLLQSLQARATELLIVEEHRPSPGVVAALREAVRGHMEGAGAVTRARIVAAVPSAQNLTDNGKGFVL